MKALIELIQGYEASKKLLENHRSIICSNEQEEALLIASSYLKNKRKIVVVKNNLYAAQRLYECLEGLINSEESLFFPVDESFRMEALATSPELLTQRVYVLNRVFGLKVLEMLLKPPF